MDFTLDIQDLLEFLKTRPFSRCINEGLGSIFKRSGPSSEDFVIPDWVPQPEWDEETLQLLKDFCFEDVPKQSHTDIITKSKNFPINFPTENNKCEFLNVSKNISEDILNRNINSVYPLIHESVLKLCCDFILFKRKYGSRKEQMFYEKMGVKDLINRLISRKAVSFVGSYDKYRLLDGTTGCNGWDLIGTDNETPPLIIDQYLSYDELKLSALLSVSSYTHFINEGDRMNAARYQDDRTQVESEGIIIGMVGPRLHRKNGVEYQEIVITQDQNTNENGFGLDIKKSIPKLFAKFYVEKSLNYNEALKAAEKNKVGRYVSVFDALLAEANTRARASSQLAYLHVVGLGLGVWKISPHQDQIFMDTFAKRISFLGEKLDHISDIYFAYIHASQCGDYSDGELFKISNHPKAGIRIHLGKKDPHKRLESDDAGKLLVVSYAWDGNALPGNEYWWGSLKTSGDPAAACSTQITEIHNPHINPMLSADSLRIVTDGEVLTFKEYKRKILPKG